MKKSILLIVGVFTILYFSGALSVTKQGKSTVTSATNTKHDAINQLFK